MYSTTGSPQGPTPTTSGGITKEDAVAALEKLFQAMQPVTYLHLTANTSNGQATLYLSAQQESQDTWNLGGPSEKENVDIY